jgi:hypothetical protein
MIRRRDFHAEGSAMDESVRSELLGRLTVAKKRQAQATEALQAHADRVEQGRKALGNPYFYGERSPDDPESEAHFTGYESHEHAFSLWREWHDASREIAAIRKQLEATGGDPG